MKTHIWIGLFALYAILCAMLGWDHHIPSLLVVGIALFAFLGWASNVAQVVMPFGKPKDDEEINPWKMYWLMLRGTMANTEFMAMALATALFFVSREVSVFGGHEDHAPHFHFPKAAFWTIIGIMTSARIAMTELLKSVASMEQYIGKYWTLVLLSILSSLSGEPANAAIQNAYLRQRVDDDETTRTKVGVGLAATIGSGGGLTPFAPPAVIIIWDQLKEVYGWGLTTLIVFVGLAVVAHVLVCVKVYAKHVNDRQIDVDRVPGDYTVSWWSLGLFGFVVAAHIFIALPFGTWATELVYSFDMLLGAYNLAEGLRGQMGRMFDLHRLERDMQPLIIGFLLVAIETIGLLAEPGITWIGGLIPVGSGDPLVTAMILGALLFFLTGFTSAVADNALATKVYIVIPATVSSGLIEAGGFVQDAALIGQAGAISVVIGALTWGWAFVQGNLPNFPIKTEFDIHPDQWWRLGLRFYGWTLIVPFSALMLTIWFILPWYGAEPLNFQVVAQATEAVTHSDH